MSLPLAFYWLRERYIAGTSPSIVLVVSPLIALMVEISKSAILTGWGKRQIVHTGPESSVPARVAMIMTITLLNADVFVTCGYR